MLAIQFEDEQFLLYLDLSTIRFGGVLVSFYGIILVENFLCLFLIFVEVNQ